MRRLVWGAAAAAAIVAGAASVWAPWSTPPDFYYESVSGYPMRVYYRNVGTNRVEVIGAAGMPALAVDTPLPQERIDGYLAEVKRNLTPSTVPAMVKAGDYMRFEIADPDRLADEGQKTDKTTWFYLFAAVETPRSAIVESKWVSELCLVAKTGEPFSRCPTHNTTYASD